MEQGSPFALSLFAVLVVMLLSWGALAFLRSRAEKISGEISPLNPEVLKKRIADRTAELGDAEAALAEIVKKLLLDDATEDVVRALDEADVGMFNIALVLKSNGQSATEIIRLLVEGFSPSPGVLADVMMPTVVGGETPLDRARLFAAAFLEATEETDPDLLEKDIVKPLINSGLSAEQILDLLMEQDLELEVVLSAFPNNQGPSVRKIVAFMQRADLDLNWENTGVITDTTGYGIENVVQAMREEGLPAGKALECLGSDELGYSFAALFDAGYSAAVCLDALYEDETLSASAGDVVSEALDREISEDDIIAFLKRQRITPRRP